MRSYFFMVISFGIQIGAMEQLEKKIDEWDMRLFISGNKMYEDLACSYLKDSGIDLKEKFVLDIGSKAGDVSNVMAQLVGPSGLVMGIDSDKNMIKLAQKKYKDKPHLSFHEGFAESLEPSAHSIKFNIAVLFHSFDLLENKLEACKRIHECLYPNGEFLVNVGSGKEPLDFQVTREMVASIPLMRWVPGFSMLEKLLDESYLREEDYQEIFKKSGFDIISFTRITEAFLFKSKEEFAAMKRPIVMSKSIMQSLPTKMSEWVFNSFIEKFLIKLKKNNEGYYICPIEEILIHARKSDKK